MQWDKMVRWFLIAILMAGMLVAILLYQVISRYETMRIKEPTRLIQVRSGMTALELVQQWVSPSSEEEIPFLLKCWLFLHPELLTIRLGTYQIQENMRIVDALRMIVQGREHQFQVTFIEGERFSQWLARLQALPHLQLSIVDSSEQEIAQKLQLDTQSIEGWLLPETYAYRAGDTDFSLLRRAHEHMRDYLSHSWPQRAQNLPLTSPYEALILASIIEKETADETERSLIASVMVNRLHKGMRLQTDPSVIYGLGAAFNGNLQKQHLLGRDNRYNTYYHKGLPPTPIAMPGKGSIDAALHPDQTKYLYFVSRGDGTHYFSNSLTEHNRAVRKYILGKK